MARIAAIVDRSPRDPEWKGAFSWKIILSLAESQHEVLALTTLDPSEIDISHPRLTIARPSIHFKWTQFPKWVRALFQFQPQIVHTFALKSEGLNLWPLLAKTLSVFPNLQRYSTVFSPEDYAPFSAVAAPLDPAELLDLAFIHNDGFSKSEPYVIVPAPVSEWRRPKVDLLMLADHLEHNAGVHAHIVGGWGSTSLNDRREGWEALGPLSGRIHLHPPLDLPAFVQLARQSQGLWLRSLDQNSWRLYVSSHVAEGLKLPTFGQIPLLNSGSTANFLSRLYSHW